MLTKLQTYRHWALGLLMLTYVLGSFSKYTVEAIHFVSHLPNVLFAQEEFHSFETHTHDNDTHQHIVLAKINDIADNDDEESPIIPDHKDLKKKVEIYEKRNLDIGSTIKLKPTYPIYTFSVIENFKLMPNPPPWFHIS